MKLDRVENNGEDAGRTGWVSVIVPTYNRSGLLLEALESVRAQTYRPIEVVIVDNGSTDDTPALMDGYIRDHSDPACYDVKYIRQDNRGATAGRLRGWNACTGEFVQHLDSDDRLLPDKFEEQVRLLREHPEIDYVYGYASYTDDAGHVVKQVGRPIDRDGSWTHVAVYHWQTCAPLYRRRVLAAIGSVDERVLCAEDLIHPALIKLNGFRELFVPKPVSVWRLHGGVRLVDSEWPSAMTSELVADAIATAMQNRGIRCPRTENTLARYYARAGIVMGQYGDKAGARRCLKKAVTMANGSFRTLVRFGRVARCVMPAAFFSRSAHALWWKLRERSTLKNFMRPGY